MPDDSAPTHDDDRPSDVFPWDSIQFFLEVVRKRTLTRAARRLGVSHTTVLRRIARLERELDVKLFDRRTSGFTLTPAGRDLLQRAEGMEHAADEIFRSASTPSRIAGPVRIASVEGLAIKVLAPALVQFAERHPEIAVELVSMMHPANLNLREVDISIGPAKPTGPRLTSRVLARCDVHLYASRSYVSAFGEPTSVEDLGEHRFVDYIEDLIELPELSWLTETIGRREVAYRSTSPLVQLEAVRRGVGIGMFPGYMAVSEPQLVTVLPDRLRAERSYWIAMPTDLWRVPRMEAAARFLASTLTESFGFHP
ncbi:LysR family transcriptional regulator [Mycolicibacterium sp. YH-1]|uniref:LysR family transcriptional regulator n=1 Tax=Mycolicibacterium sp. YH-1 TaxID=2908837 RepID=UPI001F4BDD82|nr:LysR family transcriptional regulator [Mycolicibacterium sp. YH-1]UNB52793.1 LysR family transcriptional regulator [Mycolicibacterium sp. YH-1]